MMGKPHWLQNPFLCKSIKRQHCCYFWTSVVFLKSFHQGFKCHKSLQCGVFYYWNQSSLGFWLRGAIKKSKEEHHLNNKLANCDSAYWAAWHKELFICFFVVAKIRPIPLPRFSYNYEIRSTPPSPLSKNIFCCTQIYNKQLKIIKKKYSLLS